MTRAVATVRDGRESWLANRGSDKTQRWSTRRKRERDRYTSTRKKCIFPFRFYHFGIEAHKPPFRLSISANHPPTIDHRILFLRYICTVNKTKMPFQFCTMFKQIQTTTQEDCREGSAFRWYFYIIITHVVFKLTKAELAIGTWVSNRNRVEGKSLARAASRVCTPLTRIATNSIIPTNGYCAQRVKNT